MLHMSVFFREAEVILFCSQFLVSAKELAQIQDKI